MSVGPRAGLGVHGDLHQVQEVCSPEMARGSAGTEAGGVGLRVGSRGSEAERPWPEGPWGSLQPPGTPAHHHGPHLAPSACETAGGHSVLWDENGVNVWGQPTASNPQPPHTLPGHLRAALWAAGGLCASTHTIQWAPPRTLLEASLVAAASGAPGGPAANVLMLSVLRGQGQGRREGRTGEGRCCIGLGAGGWGPGGGLLRFPHCTGAETEAQRQEALPGVTVPT